MTLRARLLDGLTAILARLPLGLADGVAWGIAWAWWWAIPVRRAVAEDNLRQGLPTLDARERPRVLRRSLHDLALGYIELLRFLRDPADRAIQVRTEGMEPVLVRQREGLPSLVLQGHFGAWDLVLLALGRDHGVRLSCIAKPPADPWSAALVERARRARDIELIPPRGSMDRVYRALHEGRVIIFAMDQRFNEGIEVPFLGRPALTATGLAAAARRAGVPVFPVHQWREGRGLHAMRVEPALQLDWTDDAEADVARATSTFNEVLGAWVRERPHGWLWLHRRWRT